jgi:hypothetical protein
MLSYLSNIASPNIEPAFIAPESQSTTILELGAGMGVVGLTLAETLSGSGRTRDQIILTDLPDVCPLLEENLRSYSFLVQLLVSVEPLAWGNETHAMNVLKKLQPRPVSHIICSDLVCSSSNTVTMTF